MNRRTFITSSLAAASGALLFRSYGLAQVAQQKRKITIIGAGLAGLVAGYELDKLGHDVTILEAQQRPGGRVLTYRQFDEPGLYADAGAARIPRHHDLTHKYVREFDLPLIPFYPTDGKFLRVRGGRAEQVGWDKFEDATSMVMSLDEPDDWRKIQGGNDRLPRAFASKLGTRVKYGVPVVRIEQATGGVTVKFQEKDRLQSLQSDYVIAAIPFTMLAKIEVAPAFSSPKAEVIRSMEYDSASRVFLETRQRRWRGQNLNGFAFGEDAAEIWESTFGQSGSHGILQTYLRGGYSTDLMQMAERDRIESTVAKLEKLFPGTRTDFVKGISKCWSEDPWVLGAWARPGRSWASAEMSQQPEGRILFAGEHLSKHSSWMQGALASGLHVVTMVRFVSQGASVLTI